MSSDRPRVLVDAAGGIGLRGRAAQNFRERLVVGGLLQCAAFSLLVTAAIICVLFSESIQFFQMDEVSFGEFFFTSEWSPLLGGEKRFGVWPLISGTLLVTAVAMAFALPLGLVTAVFLSEYAPRRLRAVLKPALEILAGIPTVVYGFFALTVITPGLQFFHEGFHGRNAFGAGIAVGILCLPIVSSLTEDALQAVPRSLRDAAYGLGGTRFDVAVKVVVPAALSGIVSAFLLAIARAIGETMIVTLAAGALPQMTLDPRHEVQTMTGYMAEMAKGDIPHQGAVYLSLYAVAATLFVITFILTIVGQVIRQRFREAYQ